MSHSQQQQQQQHQKQQLQSFLHDAILGYPSSYHQPDLERLTQSRFDAPYPLPVNALLHYSPPSTASSSTAHPIIAESYFFDQMRLPSGLMQTATTTTNMINIPHTQPLAGVAYYRPAQRREYYQQYVERIVHNNGEAVVMDDSQSPLVVDFCSFSQPQAAEDSAAAVAAAGQARGVNGGAQGTRANYWSSTYETQAQLQQLQSKTQNQLLATAASPPDSAGSSRTPGGGGKSNSNNSVVRATTSKRGPPNSVLADLPTLALSEIDPTILKRLSKAEKKKIREHNRNLVCFNCQATTSPIWRRSECKQHMLCNACGLYWKHNQSHRPLKEKSAVPSRRRGGAGGGSSQVKREIPSPPTTTTLSQQTPAKSHSSIAYECIYGDDTVDCLSTLQNRYSEQQQQQQQHQLNSNLNQQNQQHQQEYSSESIPSFQQQQQQQQQQPYLSPLQQLQFERKQIQRAQRLMGQGSMNFSGTGGASTFEDYLWTGILGTGNISSSSSTSTGLQTTITTTLSSEEDLRGTSSFDFVNTSYNV
ncbi:hypothetical protein BDR26DRAFT_871590 [Obelidium mucronatum]|nr:hypothetical protein BDR26DRAFT_871590 [Obelidium mucronatum]